MKIAVYSEQDLTPRAKEVLRSIIDEKFPDLKIGFYPWDLAAGEQPEKALVFGRVPEGADPGTHIVTTYSIAQMMTKPNAASVIAAAIQHFITEQPEPPFRFPLGVHHAEDVIARLDTSRPTVIDIETDGNLSKGNTVEEINVISIGFYQEGKPPIVLTGFWSESEQRTKPLTQAKLLALGNYLPKFEYAIYHNGKFDTRVLNRVLGTKLTVGFDTMLAHHVLNHAAGDHKLKHLAQRYFNAPEWEKDLKKYTKNGGHYELIPRELLVEYNGWDVYWTYKLWEFLAPQIESDDDNQKAFLLEMEAARFLQTVEEYGIPFDSGYARSFAQGLEAVQAGSIQRLDELGYPLNPNSPKQVKEFLLNITGREQGSSDEATLLAVQAQFTPGTNAYDVIDTILAFRKAGKTRGTYALGWLAQERGGRVRPTYLVHGTTTGRLSSTGPNAQNVPRNKSIRRLVRTHG